MRIGNLGGRLTLFTDEGAVDVHKASEGLYGPEVAPVFDEWSNFVAWAATVTDPATSSFDSSQLQPPSPNPTQIFAVGLNYLSHAQEANSPIPEDFPLVFTKFASSLAGAVTEVELPEGNIDWEVELVVVIGKGGHRISEERAWDYVAGLSVGQDITDRVRQMAGPAPQFSMSKSFPGFSPFGPWLVTPDEFDDPNDLELGCRIGDTVLQRARTNDLIFSVPEIIAGLSSISPLLPGDVIFTGTPAGVGWGRRPQRYLQAGEELVSWVNGIGEIRQQFVDQQV